MSQILVKSSGPLTARQQTAATRVAPKRSWPVPVALVALSAIPLIAGTRRLVQLAGGPEVMPADERFASFPVPLVLHLVGAATYALVGVLQFVPRFRRGHRTWHRRAGRILAVAGLLVAASALWMTLIYAQKPGTGDLLYVLRLVFGSAMAACLVLGFTAIRRRDTRAHRAWMIRAYAIGLAAGTQAFTEGVSSAVLGTGVVRDDLAKGAGGAINIAFAEWVIRRPERGSPALLGPVGTTKGPGDHPDPFVVGLAAARSRCRSGHRRLRRSAWVSHQVPALPT